MRSVEQGILRKNTIISIKNYKTKSTEISNKRDLIFFSQISNINK